VLESLGLPLGAVVGCFGLERHVVTFRGQSAHAGSTPLDTRRDAFAAAARLALEAREIARRLDGLATVGSVSVEPGIPTAVAGLCELVVDHRRLDAEDLARMVAETRDASERIAAEERVEVEWRPLFSSAPVPFDPDLVELADEAAREVAGASHRLASGPLHDATEVARAGVPTAMLFVQSVGGLSHTRAEDTKREHLELAVRAFDRLVEKTLTRTSRKGERR
jgi:N-carbamoyl-L-amino-acid hydrolase